MTAEHKIKNKKTLYTLNNNKYKTIYKRLKTTNGSNNLILGNASYETLNKSNQVYIKDIITGNSKEKWVKIKYDLQARDLYAQTRSLSDKKLKKKITPLNLKKSALNTIKDLKTYQFYWKNKKEYGKGPQIGLIAQEVKKIIPQVVRKKIIYLT